MRRVPSTRQDFPDIETFDVPERATAMTDDLDFPDVPFDEPRSRQAMRGDALDAEFADLLDEMSSGQPQRPSSYRTRQDAYYDAPPPAARQAEPRFERAVQAEENYPAYGAASQDWQMPQRAQYEDETFFEDTKANSIAEDDEDRRPRKRAKWLAALFGSVAVVAGGSVVAMKFTGVADTAPIVVRADASPIKIRPENPGGVAVPNQDNQVYERVAGGSPAEPAQPKLLTSAEEPVSLDEPSEEGDLLPGLDLGEDIDAEPSAKGEDRLAEGAAEEARPEEAPIALAPRKVRTMTVRADGTLVQTEPDATPEVAALVQNAGVALDKVRQGDTAGVDDTDSTASVIPSSAEPAAPAPAPEAAKPAVAAAAPGSWSIQISSQPSEAAARTSYAELAKRYSGVLAGRDVNIVKAEIAGKGTFWRVRVAADTRSAAVDLCTSYKAAGGNCFVSK